MENKYLQEIGKRIKKYRKEKKVLLKTFIYNGISASTLYNIETGQRDSQLTTYLRIAELLKINIKDLLP